MIGLLIASSILGLVIFISLVVIPVAFSHLTQENAGRFVRNLFPKFHLTLFALSQLAAILACTPHLKPIALICGVIFAIHFLWLTPAINKASDQGDERYFKKLHRLSVFLHLLVMLLLVAAISIDYRYF